MAFLSLFPLFSAWRELGARVYRLFRKRKLRASSQANRTLNYAWHVIPFFWDPSRTIASPIFLRPHCHSTYSGPMIFFKSHPPNFHIYKAKITPLSCNTYSYHGASFVRNHRHMSLFMLVIIICLTEALYPLLQDYQHRYYCILILGTTFGAGL
jgi:hypothetical protein